MWSYAFSLGWAAGVEGMPIWQLPWNMAPSWIMSCLVLMLPTNWEVLSRIIFSEQSMLPLMEPAITADLLLTSPSMWPLFSMMSSPSMLMLPFTTPATRTSLLPMISPLMVMVLLMKIKLILRQLQVRLLLKMEQPLLLIFHQDQLLY